MKDQPKKPDGKQPEKPAPKPKPPAKKAPVARDATDLRMSMRFSSPRVKEMLREIAAHTHRGNTNQVEKLILDAYTRMFPDRPTGL